MASSIYLKVIENEAADSFVVYLKSTYGESHVRFTFDTLEEIFAINSSAPFKSRKLIALYLDNRNDSFSKTFCPLLLESETKSLLEQSYYVVGWDISYEKYFTALQKVLDKFLQFRIKDNLATLLIIYPIDKQSASIYKVFSGENQNAKDIVHILKDARQVFNEDMDKLEELETINANTEYSIGPRQFQQMMFDMLGDRDYDCFEFDEHEYLKDKIGYAKYGQPTDENGYDAKQKEEIQATYLKIVEQNNRFAQWQNRIVISFIYNCLEPLPEEKLKRMKNYSDYNPKADLIPIPIYVIKKCYGSQNPCRIFIDASDRVYESWENYIANNKLHECLMVLPKGGRYWGNEKGEVELESHFSPACGIGQQILQVADTASTAAGVGSAIIFGVSMIPAIAVAPVVLTAAAAAGVTAGAYSITRSVMNVYDRAVHQQSMSFQNSEARGAYLNILAGSLGFVGAGATGAMSHFAASGVNIGTGARFAVNTIGVVNIGVSAGNLTNSVYHVLNDWINEDRTPSLLTLVQLSSSILFFGNAVYNFRTSGTIIEEAQARTLRDVHDSLRLNRLRKTFNKMVKETIRQNSGDAQAGHAEVISAVRKMENQHETFAMLTCNNKLFNKHGIRFSTEGGQIKLNGMAVDLSELGLMSRTQKTKFLMDLPSTPTPTSLEIKSNIAKTTAIYTSAIQEINPNDILKYKEFLNSDCMEVVSMSLCGFSIVTQENLVKIAIQLLRNVESILKIQIDTYFPNGSKDKLAIVLKSVINFCKGALNKYEVEYQEAKQMETTQPWFDLNAFNKKWGFSETLDDGKRAIFWFEKAVSCFMNGKIVDKLSLEPLLKYFLSELSSNLLNLVNDEEKIKKRKKNTVEFSYYVKCSVCKGYYFGNFGIFILR